MHLPYSQDFVLALQNTKMNETQCLHLKNSQFQGGKAQKQINANTKTQDLRTIFKGVLRIQGNLRLILSAGSEKAYGRRES